jgi:hypothetical protein
MTQSNQIYASSPRQCSYTGGIPKGSYIVGFLNEGTASSPNWVATANSGAILEDSPPPTVPKPWSIVTLGVAILLGLAAYRKRGASVVLNAKAYQRCDADFSRSIQLTFGLAVNVLPCANVYR